MAYYIHARGFWSCINEQVRTESEENKRRDRMGEKKNNKSSGVKERKKIASEENIKRNNYFVKPKQKNSRKFGDKTIK